MARLRAIALSMALLRGASFASGPQWTAPSDEELKMTSAPEAPGAGAIYLFREQITNSIYLSTTYYVRIKVLNDSGKQNATVELPYDDDADIRYEDFAGRTIHRDGSIVVFSGKPFEKIVEKTEGHKIKVKIFNLPSVEVGSILEYRFKQNSLYDRAPDWYVQDNLYLRRGHFAWTQGPGSVAWMSNLPAGAKVTQGRDRGTVELNIEKVAPQPHEPMMPPLDDLTYRVMFYYTSYTSADEFWNATGKDWSQFMDKFVTPGKSVRKAVTDMMAPGDSDEQKLRRIYTAIMAMNNTDYGYSMSAREEKAKGFKEVESTDDVFAQGRGSGNQLTDLFVSMVRAAGLKAYIMRVADRSEHIFVKGYLSARQIDNYIAIVDLGGHEIFLDPGQRFCPFGQLSWFHSYTEGQRQTDTGTRLERTPGVPYRDNRTTRVADLKLDAQGGVSGTITVTYAGDASRQWRQAGLRNDNLSLRSALKASLTRLLPATIEVEVSTIGDLAGFDKPLPVTFDVHGSVGASTAKRLLVPAFLFQAQATPLFPSERREVPVDLRYADLVQDAVRYTIPAGLLVESAPVAVHEEIKGMAAFETSAKQEKKTVMVYRNLGVAQVIFRVAEYPALQNLYKKIQSGDQESIVFLRESAAASPGN